MKTPSAVISFSAQSQTAVLPIPLRQRAPPGFGNPHPERPRPPVVDSGDLAADAGDGNQRPAQIAAPRTARRPARRSRGREASGGAVLNTFKVEAGANCIVFGRAASASTSSRGCGSPAPTRSSGSTSIPTAAHRHQHRLRPDACRQEHPQRGGVLIGCRSQPTRSSIAPETIVTHCWLSAETSEYN